MLRSTYFSTAGPRPATVSTTQKSRRASRSTVVGQSTPDACMTRWHADEAMKEIELEQGLDQEATRCNSFCGCFVAAAKSYVGSVPLQNRRSLLAS